MLKIKIIASAACLATLTACGGSSGTSTGVDAANPGPVKPITVNPAPVEPGPVNSGSATYNKRFAEMRDFFREHPNYGNYFPDRTPVDQMPQSGKATYSGSSLFSIDDEPDDRPHALGRSSLTADFSNNRVNGTMDQFVAAPGHETTGGKLEFDGRIIENGFAGGRVTGGVNLDGTDHRVNDPIYGLFFDENADSYAMANDTENSTTSAGSSYTILGMGQKN